MTDAIEVTRWLPYPTGTVVDLLWDADLERDVKTMKQARWYLNDMIVHNRDPWIRHSTRERLKLIASQNDSAVKARLFVLIAEGNLIDALMTLDSLIGQAE